MCSGGRGGVAGRRDDDRHRALDRRRRPGPPARHRTIAPQVRSCPDGDPAPTTRPTGDGPALRRAIGDDHAVRPEPADAGARERPGLIGAEPRDRPAHPVGSLGAAAPRGLRPRVEQRPLVLRAPAPAMGPGGVPRGGARLPRFDRPLRRVARQRLRRPGTRHVLRHHVAAAQPRGVGRSHAHRGGGAFRWRHGRRAPRPRSCLRRPPGARHRLHVRRDAVGRGALHGRRLIRGAARRGRVQRRVRPRSAHAHRVPGRAERRRRR